MSQSLVSLIIAVHEPGAYLREACESALTEAPSAEIIVIDDASTEELWDSIGDLRVQYFRLGQRRGIGGARNYGACRASGEYLIFLDATDRCAKDGVTWRVAYLDSHPSISLVAGKVGETSTIPSSITKDWARQQPLHKISAGTLAFRRPYFTELGGFDAAASNSENDLLRRALERGPIPFFEKPTIEAPSQITAFLQ